MARVHTCAQAGRFCVIHQMWQKIVFL